MKSYDQVVYRSVWDSTNVYFYRSNGGPRMAFVVMPGGDPSDITLKFAGQDSLHVDWDGALKVYLKERWIKINEAVAYQVDANNDIIPLSWTGEYEHSDSSAFVNFQFDTYDISLPLILEVGYPPMMMGGGPDYRNMNWSTYAGSNEGDELECVEVDSEGNPYACGYVRSSFFPIYAGYTVYTPFISQPVSTYDAVIMKVGAEYKQTQWATYYGGTTTGAWTAKTKAHKLAVFEATTPSDLQYAFVTGSTNATDFDGFRRELTVFEDAWIEDYGGGITRAWVGAFKKTNGQRDWVSSHGQSGGATWSEHGLSIDVDEGGKLVVGGQIETLGNANTIEPDFPLVTPSGAFSRAIGGGFYIVFNENYQIEWATTFSEFDETDCYSKVTDLRIDRMTNPNRDVIWLVGTSASGTADPLNTVEIPGVFYDEASGGVMIARIDISNHQIEYCTRWCGSEAYGVHVTGKSIWVVGYTTGSCGPGDHYPDPGGNGVHHTDAHAGTTYGQGSDGFILRYDRAPLALTYGTLIGGLRDDILLDVNGHNDRVYITGETRSVQGFATDLNPNFYFQDPNDYWNRRDALILSLYDDDTPTMLWRTPFGGTQSERGWGIAASATEVYLVGATASQQFEEFPLWDFDGGSQLDLYQDWNLGGNTSSAFVPFYQFCGAMDHEFTQWGVIESLNTPHDGFMTSFGVQQSVGIEQIVTAASTGTPLLVIPTGDAGQWLLTLPPESDVTIAVYDVTGRCVLPPRRGKGNARIDLSDTATGQYQIVAAELSGVRRCAKVFVR